MTKATAGGIHRAVRTALFDYELPRDAIAQRPLADRAAARLLTLQGGTVSDETIHTLPDLVPPKTVVVVNNTRVLPARLLGTKEGTGGKVELLLLEPHGDAGTDWIALVRASKRLQAGGRVSFGGELLSILMEPREHGTFLVRLIPSSGGSVRDAIRKVGRIPLPPYITRPDDEEDKTTYQTVFASEDGAVAAPTAGLHLTGPLLDAFRARGMSLVEVTLHVGLGTFRPVAVDDLDQHPMHEEWCSVSKEAAEAIAGAQRDGRAILAVGTTVIRTLETAAMRTGTVEPYSGRTRLLIQPGFAFRAANLLLTNFHVPRSTLLALVCAFGGTREVLSAYQHAVEQGYRFLSYGDAMLIARSP